MKAQIVRCMRDHVARVLSIDASEVHTDVELAAYGISSSNGLELLARLEELLGVELSPVLLYEYPTIEQFAEFLSTTPAPRS